MDLDEEGEQSSESGESEYQEEDPPEIHVASMSNEQAIIPADIVDEFSFVSHRLTGTVHVIKNAEENLLACGRRLTMNHFGSRPSRLRSMSLQLVSAYSAIQLFFEMGELISFLFGLHGG